MARSPLMGALLFGCIVVAAAAQAGSQPHRLEVGDTAPPITLERISNGPRSAPLDWPDLAGKTVVVEFWGTWCGGCVVAIPHLNQLHREFSGRGVVFLSVTYENEALVKRFQAHRPINTWIGHDLDRSMIQAWGITEWPTVFVVRDRRILLRAFTRELTVEKLTAYLDRSGDKNLKSVGGTAVTAGTGGGRSPGVKPSTDEDAVLQVTVRRKRTDASTRLKKARLAIANDSIRNIVARLWNVPPFKVIGGNWIDNEQFIVDVAAPRGSGELTGAIRDVVAASLGIVVDTVADARVSGWRLVTGDNGITLPEGVGEKAGWAIDVDDSGDPVIAGAAMTMDDFAMGLSLLAGRPIENSTGLKDRYFVDFSIEGSLEAWLDGLDERCGLKAVASEIIMSGVTVRRVD